MPQGALQANVATNPSLARAPLTVDASGNLLTGSGSLSKLNQTGTFLVKGSAGRICKINVVGGTAAALVVNDVATTGGVATANIVASLTSAQAAVGTTIPLDFPCLAGIVVQAGTAVVAVSFD
jgi:hypothetical protein